MSVSVTLQASAGVAVPASCGGLLGVGESSPLGYCCRCCCCWGCLCGWVLAYKQHHAPRGFSFHNEADGDADGMNIPLDSVTIAKYVTQL